ncbi:thioredoxin family protein [Defluviimonas sp. WL0002]|uniref:Thioredoxin family protein n=1 Tax=Albidovulum marisflavi TaxID=2984159 RepID=A0ABT2Z8N2_9RHOB|nr:thioredoxin family protein [Defluviimonas sp. WL0002]MCV2867489.1 thioredoxin family protein [Defluviimonas sp. WL0002]
MRRRDLFLYLAAAAAAPATRAGAQPVLGDDGLHKQPFFLDSFLELGSDLDDAAAEGKGLIVLFEQRGCPYCRELHHVNFERAEIRSFIEANYHVLQLDLWGARQVLDFDGEELEERDLARKWYVNFTPTQILFPPDSAGATGFGAGEAFRLPGYFKPFHHLSGLEYVAGGAYRERPFQRFLQEKFAVLEAQGIDPDVW